MRAVRSRPSSRPSGAVDRTRAAPPHSRLTIRRPDGPTLPLTRPGRLGEALREGREALADIQAQLDALLAALRGSAGSPPDAGAPDRLHRAARRADDALGRLVRA